MKMDEYIDRNTFLAEKREWYCKNCDRRKNSKGKLVYEIGDAPCRACDIGDILDAVEDYHAADVVERKTGKWIPVTELLPKGADKSGELCENVWLFFDDGNVYPGWMNGITEKVYYLGN